MTQGKKAQLLELLARYAYQYSETPIFPLASGEVSDEYMDCKKALSRPEKK